MTAALIASAAACTHDSGDATTTTRRGPTTTSTTVLAQDAYAQFADDACKLATPQRVSDAFGQTFTAGEGEQKSVCTFTSGQSSVTVTVGAPTDAAQFRANANDSGAEQFKVKGLPATWDTQAVLGGGLLSVLKGELVLQIGVVVPMADLDALRGQAVDLASYSLAILPANGRPDAASSGSSSTTTTAPGPDPCDLVDEAAASALVGQPVGLTRATTTPTCRVQWFNTTSQATVGYLDPPPSVDFVRNLDAVTAAGPWAKTEIPGLGDAAVYLADPAVGSVTYGELTVAANGKVIKVTVSLKDGDPAEVQRVATALATTAVGTL